MGVLFFFFKLESAVDVVFFTATTTNPTSVSNVHRLYSFFRLFDTLKTNIIERS